MGAGRSGEDDSPAVGAEGLLQRRPSAVADWSHAQLLGDADTVASQDACEEVDRDWSNEAALDNKSIIT